MRQFTISIEDDEYEFLLSLAKESVATIQTDTPLYTLAQKMSIKGFVTGGYPKDYSHYECHLTAIGHSIAESSQHVSAVSVSGV